MCRIEIRSKFRTDVDFGNMSRTNVAVGQMSCYPAEVLKFRTHKIKMYWSRAPIRNFYFWIQAYCPSIIKIIDLKIKWYW